MKFKRDFIKWLSLAVFMLTMVFASSGMAIEQETATLQLNYEKTSYESGDLLKAEGSEGGTVYKLGSDGKKYAFPGSKTYFTWYDDFSKVKKVPRHVLDGYDVGGIVTVQPGTQLVTTADTAKVFLVGEDGEVIHIPNEATARKFYGNEWQKMVTDIDPGVFAISYKPSKKFLTESTIPNGALVQESSGDYFLIENGYKRKVRTEAFGANGLHRKNVLKIKKLPSTYDDGDEVEVEEESISSFDPGAGNQKIVICHKPSTSNSSKGKTIKVSSRALAAHLAHGDTRGACSDDDGDDDDDDDLPSCENPRIISGTPLRIKYWQELGLDTSAHPEIYKYQIQWFSGYWSPWYTPGVDDVDWKLSNRRVWSYFEDHNYRIKTCEPDEEPEPVLNVCDHNSDGVRDLTDIALFAECSTTFDVNGDGIHDLTDIALYGLNNQDDAWCETNFMCVPEEPEPVLNVCDHNSDGVRDIVDVALFAECSTTFDVNGDGVHDLSDVSLYASNNQDDAWCETNFMCVPEEDPEPVYNVCDHSGDGIRDLTDVSLLAQCIDTFDVNGDGIHDLVDVSLYSLNNQDDAWCETNFMCVPQ